MNPQAIKPGIYPGLGMETYHAWKLDKDTLIEGPVSCSTLKRFALNPYAWRWTPEPKQTDAMRTGSLFDLAVTDPDALGSQVVASPYDNYRTKEAREWRADQLAAGLVIADADEVTHAQKAAERVREHRVAGPILDGADFQVGCVGDIAGIPAKCLLDILPGEDGEWAETLVDYKTTSFGLNDEAIRRALGKWQYHWQAAFYSTLWNKVSPDRVATGFAFIFQDTVTLEIRVVKLSDDAMALGTRAVKHAVEEYTRCAHKGIGSRYAASCDSLDLLPYHAMNEDELLTNAHA